jgi:hypothetical protein
VTVVVVVPGQAEPWQVANAAFRLLVDEVREIKPPGEAMPLIVRGQMYGCLDLTELGTVERDEVALALAKSARRVRRRLVDQSPADEWEAGLIERLGVLEMWMDGLVEAE